MKGYCPTLPSQQQTYITGRVRRWHRACSTNLSESTTTTEWGINPDLRNFQNGQKKQKLVIRKNDFMALTEITESLGTFLWKVFAKATDRHLKLTFSLICWRIRQMWSLYGERVVSMIKSVTATIGTFLLPCFILQFFWRTFVHGPFEVKELFLSTNVPLS